MIVIQVYVAFDRQNTFQMLVSTLVVKNSCCNLVSMGQGQKCLIERKDTSCPGASEKLPTK